MSGRQQLKSMETQLTFPNVPFPSTFNISKSSIFCVKMERR